MNDVMDKRQAAMIRELVCPKCRGELWQITRLEYHCPSCQTHYSGEEKPNASH